MHIFQSTLPRRERLSTAKRYGGLWYNFNPRSREGSDIRGFRPLICFCISIHAPAKGATKTVRKSFFIFAISIHAPAKGATGSVGQLLLRYVNFNPRSREGSDKIKSGCEKNLFDISIHAPAKGATIITIIVLIGYKISIHAPAKGATSNYFHFLYRFLFQSTLPRRERRVCQFKFLATVKFQSTLPRRERHCSA